MTDLNTAASDGDLATKLFSSDRDRRADLAALDEPESLDAPPEKPAEPPPSKEGEVKPEIDSSRVRDSKGRFEAQVPVSALTAEREKLQERIAQESRLREEADRRANEYARKMEAYEARQADLERKFQAAQNPPPPPPDPYTDPEGHFQYQQQTLAHQNLQTLLNVSEMTARSKHGDQIVNEATQAALNSGVNQHFLKMSDPYRGLVDWYSRAKALHEIGPDPKAYREKLEKEVREKVLLELKAGGPAAQSPQRFPGSLADAVASGPQGAQSISEEELAKSIFGSGRKRK